MLKTLSIAVLVLLAVSLYAVDSAYALDLTLDVFDYTQRVLTPSEIALLAQSGIGDYRGYDLIVMDSRIVHTHDFLSVSNVKGLDFFRDIFGELVVDTGRDYMKHSPMLELDIIDDGCPNDIPVIPADVATGVVLCYLVPSGSEPLYLMFADVFTGGTVYGIASWLVIDLSGYSVDVVIPIVMDAQNYFDYSFAEIRDNILAPYSLGLIQDVHIPILQNVVYIDSWEQLLLVFDRSVKYNDVGFVSLLFGGNSTYTFDNSDIVGSLSGQVLRLNVTSHNLSYTDAAVVLRSDAFISTVDKNNVYNSEAILPIIHVP